MVGEIDERMLVSRGRYALRQTGGGVVKRREVVLLCCTGIRSTQYNFRFLPDRRILRRSPSPRCRGPYPGKLTGRGKNGVLSVSRAGKYAWERGLSLRRENAPEALLGLTVITWPIAWDTAAENYEIGRQVNVCRVPGLM